MKVLLVEDNPKLVASLTRGLGEEGFDVTSCRTGVEALSRAPHGLHDAIVLDLGLPDLDGTDVLRRIRALPLRVPILILTARDALESRVNALDAGADDYLVKPFAFAELVSRLRALVRRAAGPRWAPMVSGVVALDDDLTVRIAGKIVPLSPREHGLLSYLVRRRGEVVTRAEILREVFGYTFDPKSNIVDVHLAHLRRKLGGGPIRIETIRGAGFRLEVDA